MDKTLIFENENITGQEIKSILKEVYSILKERGYNPLLQLVGYLTTGDLGYISSYKEARNKISILNRDQILEYLLVQGLELE